MQLQRVPFGTPAVLWALAGAFLALPAPVAAAAPQVAGFPADTMARGDTALLPGAVSAVGTNAVAAGVTRHVLIVSIDGLRPDAIDAFEARTLRRLRSEGGHARDARTIFPSKTLPSHASMLTGVDPEEHGITWNSDRTGTVGVVRVPTVFEVADDAGLETAAFFSKSKFHHLEREGSLDHSQAPARRHEHWLATRTVGDAVNYLRHRKPNLLFVHIGEPDYAGHSAGWMSRVYGWAVRRADGGVGRLLEAAEDAFGRGNFTVIVTSDHGGHDRTHGTSDPRDMSIPWIVWGAGVQPGEIAAPVRTTDTAATALWLLGVGVPPDWVGHAVAGAFTPAALLAAGEPTPDSRPLEMAVGAQAPALHN